MISVNLSASGQPALYPSRGAAGSSSPNGGLKQLGTIGGGIGRVTAHGKITLSPEPPKPAGSPFEIVKGADGNLWFNHLGAFAAGGGRSGKRPPERGLRSRRDVRSVRYAGIRGSAEPLSQPAQAQPTSMMQQVPLQQMSVPKQQ